MSAGLFTLSCPQCGTGLDVDQAGVAACPGCGSSYLSRFGHLIPTGGYPVASPTVAPADGRT
ncbi:MAG: hypothetical protein JWM12_4164 [Ilumatobacteraceae bacterium]|nr:hypothetical protein [Ilumatobacteraceae bacterium]